MLKLYPCDRYYQSMYAGIPVADRTIGANMHHGGDGCQVYGAAPLNDADDTWNPMEIHSPPPASHDAVDDSADTTTVVWYGEHVQE